MDTEARDPRDDKLANLIHELEQILAKLDDLGFGRVALSVHEAIESARAAHELQRNGPDGDSPAG